MSVILELIIALTAILILFSIANSLLVEAASSALRRRALELMDSIDMLLAEKISGPVKKNIFKQLASFWKRRGSAEPRSEWARSFFNHEFIKKLQEAEGRVRPSWIPADIFAEVFIDLVVKKGASKTPAGVQDPIALFEAGIEDLPESIRNAVEQLMRYVKQSGSATIGDLKGKLIDWYDAYMDRITEHYKKRTGWWLFATGLILAASLNVDLIFLTHRLYYDDQARAGWYAMGQDLADEDVVIDTAAIVEYISNNLTGLSGNDLLKEVAGNITVPGDSTDRQALQAAAPLPIGWSDSRSKTVDYLNLPWLLWKIAGILLMAIALSFGAPFWFDVLKKVVKADKVITKSQS